MDSSFINDSPSDYDFDITESQASSILPTSSIIDTTKEKEDILEKDTSIYIFKEGLFNREKIPIKNPKDKDLKLTCTT
jgi:hypothetical protein